MNNYYMVTIDNASFNLPTSEEAVAKAEELIELNPDKTVRIWSVEPYNEYQSGKCDEYSRGEK